MPFSFLYPNFLWLSLLAIVPLIIHLINLRKHKVVHFSDISLLKNIQSDSNSPKKINNWLILLIRILLIILLSTLFAQPYIPNNEDLNKNNGKIVTIFMDTSPSMKNKNGLTDCISFAKVIADEIIKSYPQGTLFKVIDNQNILNANFPVNANRAKDLVAQVVVGNVNNDFNLLYKRAVQEEDVQSFHVISDFIDYLDTNQYRYLPFKIWYHPVSSNEVIKPLIDSVYFESPIRKIVGEEELKIVSVAQNIKDSIDVKTNLLVNDVNYFTNTVLYKNSNLSSIIFPVFKSNFVKGIVQNEWNNELSNQLFWSYKKKEKIKVLIISKEEELIKTLQKVYATEPLIELLIVKDEKFDFEKYTSFDVLILGALNQVPQSLKGIVNDFKLQNKVLCVIPGNQINTLEYTNFYQELEMNYSWLNIKKDSLNAKFLDVKNEFFKDIFSDLNQDFAKMYSPSVYNYYPIQINSGSNFNLIQLNNNNPWLILEKNCFTFSSNISINHTNLQQHPLVVALFLKIAMYGFQNQNLYFPIFKNSDTHLTSKIYSSLKVISPNKISFNWLSDNLGTYTINKQFNETGFYEIFYKDSLVDVLAVNIPSSEYKKHENSFINFINENENKIDFNELQSGNFSFNSNGKNLSILWVNMIIVLLGLEILIYFKKLS